MVIKKEMMKLVGIIAVFLSVVYYTLIISFITQGAFANIGIAEVFYILTSFFIMLFLNLIFGVYYLSQYQLMAKMERKLPTIISEMNPTMPREERKEYADKLASKLKEMVK